MLPVASVQQAGLDQQIDKFRVVCDGFRDGFFLGLQVPLLGLLHLPLLPLL